MKLLFFILTLIFSLETHAITLKVANFSLIEKYLGEGTLLCLSVENILCSPQSMAGSLKMIEDHRKAVALGKIPYSAEEDSFLVSQWLAVNSICAHSVIHPDVLNTLVSASLKEDVSTLGISEGNLSSVRFTLDSLKAQEINLQQNGTKFENLFITHPEHQEECFHSLLLENNVLFSGCVTNEINLEQAFYLFLKTLPTPPNRVVYVDGNPNNILSIEKACEEANIYFVGICYRTAEKKWKNYNPAIAHLQLTHLQDQMSESFLSNIVSKLVNPQNPT